VWYGYPSEMQQGAADLLVAMASATLSSEGSLQFRMVNMCF